MSWYLSELLDASEPTFTMALRQLEYETGMPSADVRLVAEMIAKVQMKMRELGLDHRDTNGRELYHSLIGLVKLHDEFLVKALGGVDATDVHDLLPRIKKRVDNLDIPKKVWVMKPSVAKKLLKKNPPKRVMKVLGYRSIDSMLKRENILEIYGAIRFCETKSWQDRFVKGYKQLTPSDFETRDVEILVMGAGRWGDTAMDFVIKQRHPITHLKELGVIFILPMPIKKLQGITITTFPLLLFYINELRVYSAFFKFQQVQPNFGEILIDTIIEDPHAAAIMADQHIHWRVVHRYFGKKEEAYHPEIFEPHVQREDLEWRVAEDLLYKIEPALMFWKDLDYVGVMHDGKPISLNLMDVAVSYCNGLPYGSQAVQHMRGSLWNEIMIRYMGKEVLENQVLKQLDNKVIEPELLAEVV